MSVLIFDTETTGLPTERNASIFQPSKWPHIMQLSYIFYDTVKKELLQCEDDLIKLAPEVVITPESTAIHGITRRQCTRTGISIVAALCKFNECLQAADVVIGHNLLFDKRMIMVECNRNGLLQGFSKKPEYCTMLRGTPLCAIEFAAADKKEGSNAAAAADKKEGSNAGAAKYFKFPTLLELYTHLFPGEPAPKGAHNALADVLVCLRCYMQMVGATDILGTEPDPTALIKNSTQLKKMYKLYCDA